MAGFWLWRDDLRPEAKQHATFRSAYVQAASAALVFHAKGHASGSTCCATDHPRGSPLIFYLLVTYEDIGCDTRCDGKQKLAYKEKRISRRPFGTTADKRRSAREEPFFRARVIASSFVTFSRTQPTSNRPVFLAGAGRMATAPRDLSCSTTDALSAEAS